MTEPKIVAADVTKEFHTRRGETTLALAAFNLTIRDGEFVCILGPSGCGKSTFLRIVAGLTEPTTGTVTVGGTPVREPGADRGMVFQEYALFPWMTALQNVMYGPLTRRTNRKEAETIARAYIERVGLSGFENRYPRQLSGGMKQRVGIARVWANQPDVLLMDEPFGALDSITRSVMQHDLLDLWLQERKTVLFVTHSVEEAIYLADTVVVMSARPGRIKAVVPVTIERPRNLLGAEPLALRARLTALVEEEVVLPGSARRPGGAVIAQ